MTEMVGLAVDIDVSSADRAKVGLDKFGEAAKRTATQARAIEESAKRLGISYEQAAKKFDAATESMKRNNSASKAHADGSDRVSKSAKIGEQVLAQYSGRAGMLGSALSSLSPTMTGIAGVIGIVTTAMYGLVTSSLALADTAGQLKDFSETTGFTVTQLQALQNAASQVGVAGESVTKGLERFSVAMDDLKKGVGPTYEALLEINPALAKQFTQVNSLADAWDLFSKAVKQSDLEQANKLARAVFGRSGVELTRLARATDDAGGMQGVVTGLKEIDRITEQQATKWDNLGDAISQNMKLAKQNIVAIFATPVLEGIDLVVKGFLSLSRMAKEFVYSDGIQRFLQDLANAHRQRSGLVPNIPEVPITNSSGIGSDSARAPEKYINQLEEQKKVLSESIAMQERWAAALGSAITPTQQLQLGLDKLKLAHLENKLGAADSKQATDLLSQGQTRLNAAFREQQFSNYTAALGDSLSVSERVRQKQDQLNAAIRNGASYTDQQIKDQLRITREQANGVAAVQSQIDALTDQGKTWNMTAGQAQAYLIVQQKLNEEKAKGIISDPKEIDALKKKAAEYGRLVDQTNLVRNSTEVLSEVFKDLGGAIFKAFITGKDAGDAMLSALEGIASKLADKAFQDLITGVATGNPMMIAQAGVEAAVAFGASALADDLKLQKAREEWKKAGPEFERFLNTLSGGMQGAISQQFQQLRSQAEEFIDKAFKAGDFSAITRLLTAFSDAIVRETTSFRESFEGMLSGLEQGLGPSSPFANAAKRVKSITDELQGFIDDARISFSNDPIANAAGNNPLIPGGGETQVASATEAAQQFLLTLLGAPPKLSEVGTAMQEMSGVAVALQAALVELGMTSEEAAIAIDAGVTDAIADLANKFSDDLQREINSALGKDYLNEFSDLIEKYQSSLADAALLGTSSGIVDKWFQVSIGRIIQDSGLAGDAIAELIALFPHLAGVITDASAAAAAFIDPAREQADRQRNAQTQFATAQSRLTAAENQLRSLYDRERSAKEALIQTTRNYLDQIRNLRNSLALNPSLSPLSPTEQYAESQRQFRETLSLALSGDTGAQGRVSEALTTYLEQSKSFNASTEAYYRDFRETQDALNALEAAGVTQLNTAQQQLSLLNQQVAGLIAINDSVMSVETAIQNLIIAQRDYASAQAAINSARDWGSRPLINKYLVEEMQKAGLSYNGNFGNGEFGAWRATQTASTNSLIGQIEAMMPQYLIDLYNKMPKTAPFQPSYASGTDFHPGGLAWVGEQGRELVNLPRGSQVMPHFQSMSFANDNGVVKMLERISHQLSLIEAVTFDSGEKVVTGVKGLAAINKQTASETRQASNKPASYGNRKAS